MAILDINKNSLPEQVQENKENIAALQTAMDDKASTQYVDEKDADTLQSAKDYTDDTSIPKSLFTKPGSLITSDNDNNPKEFRTNGYSHGYIVTNADGLGNNGFAVQSSIPVGDIDAIATAGKVLTADGNYGCDWQDPSIKAANVESESATSGQVLTADGAGGSAWAFVGADACELLWSGSAASIAKSALANPITNYKLLIIKTTFNYGNMFFITNTSDNYYYASSMGETGDGQCISHGAIQISTSNILISSTYTGRINFTGMTHSGSLPSFNIVEIYGIK